MNSQKLFLQVLGIGLIFLFLVGCNTLTPPTPIPPTATPTEIPPISEQESQALLKAWGFEPILSMWGGVDWEADGKLSAVGDLAVQFSMNNSPTMMFAEEGEEKFFKFEKAMPRGNSTAVVILTTPELEGAQAIIPRFTPRLIDSSDSIISYMVAERFADYDGTYQFLIGFTPQVNFSISSFDTNIFYSGSEHHIYGKVELFGVKFKNVSDKPLIFKFTADRYVYIEGNGTATTKDGSIIQFGTPIPTNTPRPTSTPTPVQPTRTPTPVPPTPTLAAPLSPLPSISDTDRERYGLLPLCERIFIILGNQVLLPDWADCYREIQMMESESGRVLMLISPSAHISFLPTGMPGLVFEGIAFRTYSLNGDTINEAEVSPWSTGRVGAYYNEDTPTTWNIIVSFDKGGEWSGQVDLAKSPLDLKKTIDRQAQTSLIDQSQAQDTSTLDDSLTTTSTPTAATTSLPLASVIAETVNLRAGPGTNYQVVGEARSGETLPITGRSATGDWWQVVAPDGQTAWVNAGLVEASGAERVTQVEAPPPPTANPAASGGLWVLVADSAADFPGPIQNRKWYYHWSEGRNNFIWQDMTQGPECYHAPNEMTLEICQDRMQVDTCEGNELAWRDCSRGDAALLWKAIEGGTYRFEWSANEVDGESSIWFYKHLDRVYEIGPGSELPYSATIEGVIQWELFFFIPQYDTKYQVKVYRLQP